jgi:hypothetical protein
VAAAAGAAALRAAHGALQALVAALLPARPGLAAAAGALQHRPGAHCDGLQAATAAAVLGSAGRALLSGAQALLALAATCGPHSAAAAAAATAAYIPAAVKLLLLAACAGAAAGIAWVLCMGLGLALQLHMAAGAAEAAAGRAMDCES